MSRASAFRTTRIFLFTVSCAALTATAAITPLPLAPAANSRFSDEQADDHVGGWTDQGGNDLAVLRAGRLMAAGISFDIAEASSPTGKTCIVLGGAERAYFPTNAVLPVPQLSAPCLYLLHAAAWCPPAQAQKITGVVYVDYEDGSSAEQHVRFGRDVGDWAKPDSYKNAVRAWSAYNGNTQVSLFVSRFALKPQPIKALRFESREATWMIVAASVGDEVSLKPLASKLVLKRQFAAPPPFDAPPTDAVGALTPKNIVLVIGDGMGQGAIKLTSLYVHKGEGRLLMENLPVAGLCTTYSANADVTDSAAAATAFACGQKTDNGFLGITSDKRRLTSYAELAHREGRAVGLITSDAITGATPAGFYAHEVSRGAFQGVASDLAASGFDVLIGNTNDAAWYLPKSAGGVRSDSRCVLDEMAASGYAVVSNAEAFAQAPQDKRVLGFMETGPFLDREQSLGQLTEIALARLSKNEKGFFLMVESAVTDKGGHSNNPEISVLGTVQADWIVRSAIDFARSRGDTLVLVTADHETGGLACAMSHTRPERLTLRYATTSHTDNPVALFAFGPGDYLFSGLIDNTDIAVGISRLWQIALPQPGEREAK